MLNLINIENFHGSLTTVVMAQNDTSKTAKYHFALSILHVERYTRPYQRSHAKMEKWRVKFVAIVLIICIKQTDCFYANALLSFTLYSANKQAF